MCGDEREKDKDSGRGEKEVWGEIDRMYKLVIHSEHKIIGTKKKRQAPSCLYIAILFPSLHSGLQSRVIFPTTRGAMGGGVASSTV